MYQQKPSTFETSFCLDCKKETETILDCRAGDTICWDCGLVLESNYVDETSEWRTFVDSMDDKDPERVGSKLNPLLEHGNLTTWVSKPKGAPAGSFTSLRESNLDRTLVKGFGIIGTMADRLGLVTTIKDRACEIYKNVEDSKSCKRKNLNAVLAASLFIACKEIRLSRTLKEISTVADGASKREINRAIEVIKKQLQVDMGTVQPGELVRRFCSKLGMKNQDIKAVQEAVMIVEELDIRRNPKSVLAAVIYMINQVSGSEKTVQEIAVVAEVAEGTIKKSYKDLAPYASRLIPQWYAEEVKKTIAV
ncbi:hypothetical protein REPUB_Repub09cG0054300 [Reevesia pubescens]